VVRPADAKGLTCPVLRHRLLLSPAAGIEGKDGLADVAHGENSSCPSTGNQKSNRCFTAQSPQCQRLGTEPSQLSPERACCFAIDCTTDRQVD